MSTGSSPRVESSSKPEMGQSGRALEAPFFCVITLIHGTFAPHAEWVKATSDFVGSLASTIRRPIKPLVFGWTGGYRHCDRMLAAEDLATHIAKVREDYDNVPHFLVAHSHGGNIVTYCLRRPENRDGIAGVVTLGTPFLTFHSRPIAAMSHYLRTVLTFTSCPFAILGLLFSALLCILIAFEITDLEQPDTNQSLGFLVLASGVIGPLILVLLWRVVTTPLKLRLRRVGERAKDRQAVVLSETALPSLIPVPWHCVRVTGDEAYVGLSLFADRLLQLPFRAFAYLHRGEAIGWAGAIFSLTLLVIVVCHLFKPEAMPSTPVLVLLLGPFALWCLFLGLCAVSMPFLGGLHRFLYGLPWVDALVVETRVSPLPPSVEDPHAPRFDVRPMAGALGRWLFAARLLRGNLLHTLIYKDREISRGIAHWMRSVLSN